MITPMAEQVERADVCEYTNQLSSVSAVESATSNLGNGGRVGEGHILKVFRVLRF